MASLVKNAKTATQQSQWNFDSVIRAVDALNGSGCVRTNDDAAPHGWRRPSATTMRRLAPSSMPSQQTAAATSTLTMTLPHTGGVGFGHHNTAPCAVVHATTADGPFVPAHLQDTTTARTQSAAAPPASLAQRK
jgi:hypothetical protein